MANKMYRRLRVLNQREQQRKIRRSKRKVFRSLRGRNQIKGNGKLWSYRARIYMTRRMVVNLSQRRNRRNLKQSERPCCLSVTKHSTSAPAMSLQFPSASLLPLCHVWYLLTTSLVHALFDFSAISTRPLLKAFLQSSTIASCSELLLPLDRKVCNDHDFALEDHIMVPFSKLNIVRYGLLCCDIRYIPLLRLHIMIRRGLLAP